MIKGVSEVCDFIKENDNFVVVGHYDADGLTSSGIVALMLKRFGKEFIIHTSKALDKERIEKAKGLGDTFIFIDLGSGSVSILEEKLKDKKFVIIDHHEPEKKGDIIHLNPVFSGYSGVIDISAAGCAYLVARELDEKNVDLSTLAIVGAVGDMQDIKDKGRLQGLNRKILEQGTEAGFLEVKQDIRLFGRHSRPLTQFLTFCTDPFLPGLTVNEQASREFIKNLGIKLVDKEWKWRYYCDLSEDEKKRFVSALYVYGKEKDIPEFILKNLVGEVYELKKEKDRTELKDAKEFSTLLNACGRHDKPELGIKVCIGDREEHFQEAKALLQIHRRMLRKGIEYIQKKGVISMKNIYTFDGDDKIKDTLIGVVAGMLYGAQVIKNDKPVIATVTDEEGKVKASGRGTWNLVRKGLDLGEAMEKASEAFGGAGGGHNIAAGARVDLSEKENFLQNLDNIIGRQMTK